MKQLASFLMLALCLAALTSFTGAQQQPTVAAKISVSAQNTTGIEQGSLQFVSSGGSLTLPDMWEYTTRSGVLYLGGGNTQIDVYGFAETNGLPVTIYYDFYIGNSATPDYSFSFSSATNINFTIPAGPYFNTLRCVIHE